MAATMTKRERVERAMSLQETDRVPLYDLLRCDSVFEHFAGEALPPLAADAETGAKLESIALRATAEMLDATRSPGFGPVVAMDTTSPDGFVYHHAPYEKTSWIVSRPFSDEAGAIAWIKSAILRTEAATRDLQADAAGYGERHRAGFLHTQAQLGDTVNLLAQQGVGLDDIRHSVGMELYCYLEYDEPGLVSEYLEAVTEHNLAVCHAVADPSLSPAVLTYGDIACKERLLHSPAFLRRDFFPRLKRLNEAWHEHGFKGLFHSDGYLMEVMDDIIAAGSDGLNPIETVAGMDLKVLKQQYGDRLFFAGGIDMSQLLSNGTPEQVREVCEAAVRDARPGFLMGSTTELDNSVRLENVLVMVEVAMTSGPG
jgi:hypothetical protein